MYSVPQPDTYASSDLHNSGEHSKLCREVPHPTSVVVHGGLEVMKEKRASCEKATHWGGPEGQLLVLKNDAHHVSPSALVAQLKECGSRKDLRRGSAIHTEIVQGRLLEHDAFLGTTLVSMYSKCGALEKAQEAFDELPSLNVVSWNALITGFVQNGKAKEALNAYDEMQRAGFSPDAFTFSCVLKACSRLGDLDKGREIHAQIMQQPLLEIDLVVANALVDMYAKCAALHMAHEVLDKFCPQNNISWNALIGGYAQHGHGEKALSCYKSMQKRGLSPDAVTFSCALKACGSIGDADMGQQIHTHIVRLGMFDNDVALGTALVDMYAKCYQLEDAQEVFDELPARDTVAWNALIAGYAQCDHGKEVLNCLQRMQLEGISPSTVTFSCILNACGSIRDLDKGQEIHARLVQLHPLGKDTVLSTGLVDMYAKCGALVKAQAVFDELLVRDVVSWNGLIAGYVQHGLSKDALCCFEQMQVEGFTPSAVTFECILNACGSIGAAGRGQEIHNQVEKSGLLENESRVLKALIDMHFKCGVLEKAQEVFDKLLFRDADVWNILVAGYAQHEYCEEVLYCFDQMQHEGCSPNAVTFTCILKACGNMGTLNQGQAVHADIMRFGMSDEGMITSTALVMMYANCGMLTEAQESFDNLSNKDVVAWSALMEGYAQLGDDEAVFDLFERMQAEYVEPNSVTFTIVLSTCSHRGLVDKSQAYLETLSTVSGINPSIEHQTCVVDLFARAGQLDLAVAIIQEIPVSASVSMWHSLLGACRHAERIKLGQWAFENATQSDEYNSAAYVSLENVLCG